MLSVISVIAIPVIVTGNCWIYGYSQISVFFRWTIEFAQKTHRIWVILQDSSNLLYRYMMAKRGLMVLLKFTPFTTLGVREWPCFFVSTSNNGFHNFDPWQCFCTIAKHARRPHSHTCGDPNSDETTSKRSGLLQGTCDGWTSPFWIWPT